MCSPDIDHLCALMQQLEKEEEEKEKEEVVEKEGGQVAEKARRGDIDIDEE